MSLFNFRILSKFWQVTLDLRIRLLHRRNHPICKRSSFRTSGTNCRWNRSTTSRTCTRISGSFGNLSGNRRRICRRRSDSMGRYQHRANAQVNFIWSLAKSSNTISSTVLWSTMFEYLEIISSCRQCVQFSVHEEISLCIFVEQFL